MLSKAEVERIFRDTMPEDVEVEFVDRVPFIEFALKHPYIQRQIEVGVYDNESIWFDFLSVAAALPPFKRVQVCYDLLAMQNVGVTDDAMTTAHVKMIALHEAHHFHTHGEKNSPLSVAEHAENELDCIRKTQAANPELTALAAQFEQQSLTYRRVYERMRQRAPKNIFSTKGSS